MSTGISEASSVQFLGMASTTAITGMKPLDKVLLAMLGTAGIIAAGAIAAAGAANVKPISNLYSGNTFEGLQKGFMIAKIVWEAIDPIIRSTSARKKIAAYVKEKATNPQKGVIVNLAQFIEGEKIDNIRYYIDQFFDWVGILLAKDAWGSIFNR